MGHYLFIISAITWLFLMFPFWWIEATWKYFLTSRCWTVLFLYLSWCACSFDGVVHYFVDSFCLFLVFYLVLHSCFDVFSSFVFQFSEWHKNGKKCLWVQKVPYTCVYLCLFHNPLKENLFNSWTVAQIEPQKLKKTYQVALDCVSISVTGSGRLSLPSYTFVVKIINNVWIGCVYISCCKVLFSTPCSRNKTKIIFYEKYYF